MPIRYQVASDYHARGVVIAQDSAANPAYVECIRALAAYFRAGGATVSEYGYGDDTKLHWYFGKGIDRTIRTTAPGKQLTPEFLCALTKRQARLLYQTLIDGDGSRRAPRMSKGIRRNGGADSEIWVQKDPGRINGFQMLAAMLGKRTWAHRRPGTDCQDVAGASGQSLCGQDDASHSRGLPGHRVVPPHPHADMARTA